MRFVTYLRVSTSLSMRRRPSRIARRRLWRRPGREANVLPIIHQIADYDASLRRIARELNARGIKTARGGLWYAATVRSIMAPEGEIEAQAT